MMIVKELFISSCDAFLRGGRQLGGVVGAGVVTVEGDKNWHNKSLWIDGRTDGRTNGRTDGRTDG